MNGDKDCANRSTFKGARGNRAASLKPQNDVKEHASRDPIFPIASLTKEFKCWLKVAGKTSDRFHCVSPAVPTPVSCLLWQEGTEQLIESGRYDTRDDFTVVLQPFLENVAVPRTPVRK